MQQYCTVRTNSKSHARICLLVAALIAVQLLRHSIGFAQSANYFMEHYTSNDGLPSNLVEDITWDSNNLLWASTYKGIARFDGRWIQPFSLPRTDVIKNDYCGPFFSNGNGQLFFGDALGNIYGFEKNRPVIVDSSYRMPQPDTLVRVGNIYRVMRTELNPRVLQLPKIFWPKFYKSYNRKFTYANGPSPIVIDESKILFTEQQVLSVYDRLTDKSYPIKKLSAKGRLIQVDGVDFLYEQGRQLYRIDILPDKEIKLSVVPTGFSLPDADIFWRTGMPNAIMVQSSNCWLLQWVNGQIKRTLLCNNIPANISISSIKYHAALQVLAIATDGNGIYIFRKKIFTSYINHTTNILSSVQSYYAAVELNTNELLLNSATVLDLTTKKYKSQQHLFPDIVSCKKIKDSIVFLYDSSSHFFSWSYKEKKLIRRNFPYAFFDISAFATTEGRVFSVTNNYILEFSAAKDSLFFSARISKESLAKDMIEYKPGYLVFAGMRGMYGFNIHTKKLDTLAPGSNKNFRGITQYKGYLFMACYEQDGGVFAYKDGSLKKFPLDAHQYIVNAHNIYIDQNGYAWIGVNAGVLRTKAQALIDYFNGKTSYVGYDFLGKEDGIDIVELNGGHQGSIIELKNGSLVYTGINGVVVADVSSADTAKIPADISVDRMIINDSLIYQQPSGHIQLGSGTKKIKLHLIIPLWNNLKNQIIEYRLNGYDNKWETLDYTKQNFIELINIPNGNYTLSIKTSSVYDKEIITTYTLALGIDAPWYRTRLFYMAAVIISLFTIWGIVIWRNRYLQKRNKLLKATVDKQINKIQSQKNQLEEQVAKMKIYQTKLEQDYALKNRLISMISHDMITPLRFMTNAGNKLITNKDSISPDTYDDTMRTIVETSSSLKEISTNMLNWIKHHSDNTKFAMEMFNLYDATQFIVNNVTPMARFKEVTIHNNINRDIQVHQYLEPYKSILLQLLSNGIKYCNNCNIFITAINNHDTVTLQIKDEGPGMTQQQIQLLMDPGKPSNDIVAQQTTRYGFGYLIIKDMLEIIKSNMHIESKLGQGSTIYIEIPKRIT